MQTATTRMDSPAEIVPIHNWVYFTTRFLFGLFFRAGGLRVHGAENVPRQGPLIVAPNHVSMLDPPLVGVCTPRVVTTMGKSELFDQRILGLPVLPWIIQRMGTFPVHRGTPDRRAIRRAIKVLEAGGALVIFPEGRRSESAELGPAEMGLSMIAHSAKAPIIPVHLKGTDRALSRSHKGIRLVHPEVWFGQPLYFEAEYSARSDRASLQSIGDQVMNSLAALARQASTPTH